jgi:predicted MFS family arabinose efflux permease
MSGGSRTATRTRPRPAQVALAGRAALSMQPQLRRLSGRPALYLLASLTVSLLAASSAPTPLYAAYQKDWGFTPVVTTIVFGTYALAVLVSLLIFGRLSDHVGRRPVLLVALGVQVIALVLFTLAGGVQELLAARVVQGLSTGSALGAIGAGMLDLDRPRGTLANAMTPGIGSGLGAILSGLAAAYLPAPTHLIYMVLAGVIMLQAAGVALMQETVTPSRGAAASLVPEIRLPRTVRAHILTAAPVLLAVWALVALYGALGPELVQALSGSPNVVLGGLSLTVLAGFGVAAIFMLRTASVRTVMRTGIGALLTGVVVTLLALSADSAALFFIGTAISGIGWGSGFQGSIRMIVPRVAAHERAGVLSLVFIISYLGLGVPAVAAGFLAVHGVGLIGAARYYGAALLVLAVLALVSLIRTQRNEGN